MALLAQVLSAQSFADYYRSANGKSGRALKTALHAVVRPHVVREYNQLWTDFQKTDRRPDGTVWDMYSGVTRYAFGGPAQGGNYKQEGDAYNREHSFPKSWFKNAAPMSTDLFHIYPTDGSVNNRRGNYPFGEVKDTTWTSALAWSVLGSSASPAYSGTVFAPNDEYKGDFARSYFYMATCYEDQIAGWNSPMLDGTAYPAYAPWALEVLLRWAAEDTVSQKEIDRNNAVYGIQQNRNPFIDYPGLEQYIWGSATEVPFDAEHYVPNGGGSTEKEVADPAFSVPSGEVPAGTKVRLSCTTPGASLHYTVNGGAEQVASAPVEWTVDAPLELTAYAALGEKRSRMVQASYTVASSPVPGSSVYVRIAGAEDLKAGHRYLLVCEQSQMALGAAGGKGKDIREGAAVSVAGGEIRTAIGTPENPYALTLGGTPGAYTFYDAVSRTYLALTSDKNKLHSVEDGSVEAARWTVSCTADLTEISSVSYPERSIQYNVSAPRFAAYTSGQAGVVLYREAQPDGIVAPVVRDGKVEVYNAEGRLLRRGVSCAEALKGLPRGFYIVGGVKVLVR